MYILFAALTQMSNRVEGRSYFCESKRGIPANKKRESRRKEEKR